WTVRPRCHRPGRSRSVTAPCLSGSCSSTAVTCRGSSTGWTSAAQTPGVDLQLAWSLLPPAARDEFFDEYGPVTDESLLRARVVALFLNAVLARYGSAEGMPTIAAEALASLRRASAGP